MKSVHYLKCCDSLGMDEKHSDVFYFDTYLHTSRIAISSRSMTMRPSSVCEGARARVCVCVCVCV